MPRNILVNFHWFEMIPDREFWEARMSFGHNENANTQKEISNPELRQLGLRCLGAGLQCLGAGPQRRASACAITQAKQWEVRTAPDIYTLEISEIHISKSIFY